MAKCHNTPAGDAGLEGYELDKSYIFHEVHDEDEIYYRVYPGDPKLQTGYYETCTPQIFKKHFDIGGGTVGIHL